MDTRKSNSKFIWRIMYSHVISYFIAGLFAITFMNYKEQFASDYLSHLMLPVSSDKVSLGPLLQIIRGLIIAFVLLPIRKIIIEEKYGLLKLALLVFGLSVISTIGPTPSSFEGIIYTVLPLEYHLLGLPEIFLYIFLFIFIIWISYKFEKKWISVLSVIFVIIICLFSILGYLSAIGMF